MVLSSRVMVALFPFFNLIAYFASFLTSALRDSIRKRDQAEAELREERRGLEEKVTLRTAEIERAREEIRNYARRLEETNEELRQFSSAASHDLQEPLLNILYLCDFLEPRIQALHDAGISQDVNRIRQTARRLQILVKGLLDYARFSQEEETPEKSAIAIDDILTEIKKDFEVRIQELQARVEWGKMPRVYAHRLRVRQLFQNLISNALKYHRAGVAPVIEIKAEPQDGGIAVHVTDNGVGFDPAHKEELFQPFKRLHQESIPQGSGIGLALCQKIALRYGWQLMAEGRPGEGASFTIVFPAGDIAGS